MYLSSRFLRAFLGIVDSRERPRGLEGRYRLAELRPLDAVLLNGVRLLAARTSSEDHGRMFFLISGSSGAGKTAIGPHVAGRLDGLVFHDADENYGEPLDFWVDRGLEYQEVGKDLLLATSRPFGELLACPKSVKLTAVAGCLMDCDDLTRAGRLRARPPPRDEILGMDILCWAAFHRMHADDPAWEQRVICEDDEDRRWDRWTHWNREDPRWDIPVFDTSRTSPEETAHAMVEWIEAARLNPVLTQKGQWWVQDVS